MIKILIAVLLLASLATAQTTVTMPNLVVSAEATTALNTWMMTQFSGQVALLHGLVGISDTTITVADTVLGASNNLAMIDQEVVLITAKTSTTYTVVRAQLGTVAAVHGSDAGTMGPGVYSGVMRELKYKGFRDIFKSSIVALVGNIVDVTGTPSIQTQKDAIAAAQRQIDNTKSAAVQ